MKTPIEMEFSDLVDRLRRQDPKALNQFHSAYRSRLFAWARRHVSRDADAEEVVQDALWALYRNAPSIEDPNAFWGWMRRVTVNCAHMVTRKRTPDVVDDRALERAMYDSPSSKSPDTPEECLAAKRAVDRVRGGVEALSLDNQRLFLMVERGDISRDEMAMELGITEGAMKVRLHRIRANLKSAFDGN